MFALIAGCLGVAGCMPAKSPTNALRAAVVMTAEAVQQADQVCAKVGAERKDATLLTVCKEAYNVARPALISAQYLIDAGDEAGVEAELCTGQKALASAAKAVAATGTQLPPIVTEAVQFAGSLCAAVGA